MVGVPGKGGPPPKRSSQRRRTNKVKIDTAISDGQRRGPALVGKHSAPAKRFWEALQSSGQAQFFEPSDWSAAELAVIAIDAFVDTPTAALLSSINSMMASLLVTEGDRRRLHVELERAKGGEEAADVSELADYRRRLGGAG